jgi:hypothetical protein
MSPRVTDHAAPQALVEIKPRCGSRRGWGALGACSRSIVIPKETIIEYETQFSFTLNVQDPALRIMGCISPTF